MKILIVRMWAEELNINNYNCQEIGLAKALIRKGNICDIVLYTHGESREVDYRFDNDKKIHIYYLKGKQLLKNCFYEKKLYEIVNNYDIVQSAEYDQIANLKLSKILKNKLVIYHGPYKSKYTKRYPIKCFISDIIYLFHPKYKQTKCISKSILAMEFLKSKGFMNVHNVGVGLDADRFNKIEKNESVEKLVQDKKDNKYILYVGKIEDRRNTLFLLKVFKKIVETNNKIKLILIGKGNTKYINQCDKYILENNLKNNVIHIDYLSQNELPNLYKCSDILVLPTQYEIFGMVLLEALYFNLRVVTTLNGGSSTIIDDTNGVICDNNDFEQWFNGILDSLNKPNQKNFSKYTWDSIVYKFLDIYIK